MKSANRASRLNVHSGKGFRRRSRSFYIRRRRGHRPVRILHIYRRRLAGVVVTAIAVLVVILALYGRGVAPQS